MDHEFHETEANFTKGDLMVAILFRELSYAIVGAAMEVHRQLGPGFLEAVYRKALAHELSLREIQFVQHKALPVSYKGQLVGAYPAARVVADCIVVELKTASALAMAHAAQARNYLAATGLRLAIVINFGAASLQTKRVVL